MTTTLILGASDKPERLSNRALHQLQQHGHKVLPVTPKGGVIDGIQCFTSLTEVKEAIDTVTIYINPTLILNELSNIIKLKPRRVIFNPDTEQAEAIKTLEKEGIEVVQNCTLVMLNLGIY